MAVVLLLTQALTLALVVQLAVYPQVKRVAGLLAHNVRMLNSAIDALPPSERTAFIDRVNAAGKIRIFPGSGPPPGADGRPTRLEQQTLAALAAELGTENSMVWRGGGGQQLWVHLRRGPHEAYWLALAPTEGWSPNGAVVGSIAIALAIALVTGLALQRLASRPLKALADAVDAMPDARPVRALSGHGPSEITSVARSFDRMAARLEAQERDRAFMLAGISHDLKTPLAKLRLAAALHPTGDADHDAMVARQLDRMDRMLGQFLDFGRGNDGEPSCRVDVAALVASVLETLDVGDTIVIRSTGKMAAVLKPLAFERALTNLVRNALTHGAPPIAIECAGATDAITITVADAGPGVDDDALDRLRTPFLRGEDSRPSDGSVGLGLAIVDRVVADLGGRLSLANRPTGGFAATITLPRETP
ncbi:MAG: ATP-binding protein [Sphingomonas sp.]